MTKEPKMSDNKPESAGEAFFRGLPLTPKRGVAGVETAEAVLHGAVEKLAASGVHGFAIVAALSTAIWKISEKEKWSEAIRADVLPPAVRRDLEHMRSEDSAETP